MQRRILLVAILYASEGPPIGFIWWALPTGSARTARAITHSANERADCPAAVSALVCVLVQLYRLGVGNSVATWGCAVPHTRRDRMQP